jgi:hypothetical protein
MFAFYSPSVKRLYLSFKVPFNQARPPLARLTQLRLFASKTASRQVFADGSRLEDTQGGLCAIGSESYETDVALLADCGLLLNHGGREESLESGGFFRELGSGYEPDEESAARSTALHHVGEPE